MKDYSNYATHLPLLIKSIEATDKPILELGMGISTMIIHMMCKTSGRKIVDYPNDFGFYIDYSGKITRISSESVFRNSKCKEIEIPIEPIYEIY